MSAPVPIKVIAENLADEARAIAPGHGRRSPVEVDAAGLRAWLNNFAELPAFETEDADARLHLALSSRRLVVRHAGGRLGTEERDTFVAATVEEIVTLLLETPASVAAAAEEAAAADAATDITPAARARARARSWLLVGSLAIFGVALWWTTRPESPDGVEWIGDAGECQAILAKAAGHYASDDEKLSLDADAHLVATNAAGEETLRTTVRVGRRAGGTVLATEAGVLLELAADGTLRINATDYRRVTAGG